MNKQIDLTESIASVGTICEVIKKSFSSNIINNIFDSIDLVEQAKVDAKMLISAKIADAMKEKGWRKIDLLKAVNKENPSIITKWFSGTHNFTIDTLIEIGIALDIDMLNYSDPKEQKKGQYDPESTTFLV